MLPGIAVIVAPSAAPSQWNSGDRRTMVGDEFTTGRDFHRPRGTGFERFNDPPWRESQCEDQQVAGGALPPLVQTEKKRGLVRLRSARSRS